MNCPVCGKELDVITWQGTSIRREWCKTTPQTDVHTTHCLLTYNLDTDHMDGI